MLKNAAETALYGSRGASGVIEVKTKRGTAIARLEGVLNSEFVRLPYTEGIRILQEAREEVPPVVINQKRVNTSIENLLDYRPITLRNEKERAVFQTQARICQAFREFLDGQHFTEIHTPKLVAAGARCRSR